MPVYLILNRCELPADNGARLWEGQRFKDSNASLILIDLAPGGRPHLHHYPKRRFLSCTKGALYTSGQVAVEPRSGQIVFVPKDVAIGSSMPA
jgi:quercetin dioxygenase-like cupin family protein